MTTGTKYLLLLESGAVVRLVADLADATGVESAAQNIAAKGFSCYVAQANGPGTSDPSANVVLVRPFGDPAATFAECRQRAASRRGKSGNMANRLSNGGR